MGTASRGIQRRPLRCRLGRHVYRYIGFRWEQDTLWMKSGHDHECSRCGKQVYLGTHGMRVASRLDERRHG